jgi:pre-mRNA-splicing factor SPF27
VGWYRWIGSSTNLSLLSSFGPNAHLIHNHLLEAEAKQLESTLNELKAQVVDVNRKRKNSQVRPGSSLAILSLPLRMAE